MGVSKLDFLYDSKVFIDLYEILNVDMEAEPSEIKSAYLVLAKKHHPDQGGSSEYFQEITRAYEVLHNKETRKEYDLYYLKKNMDEFGSDDISRLKDDYQNFVMQNEKPITKEELDKLYETTFSEYRDKYKEEKLIDITSSLNDYNIERKNMEIESSDDSLNNFLKENSDKININDVFEYLKFKNGSIFGNTIVPTEIGALDIGRGFDFSSDMNCQDTFNHNLYSKFDDMNEIKSKESLNNLNIDDFVNWKKNKYDKPKLTQNDYDNFIKKRQEEETKLYEEIANEMKNEVKRKEVQLFLKPFEKLDNGDNELIIDDDEYITVTNHLTDNLNINGNNNNDDYNGGYENNKNDNPYNNVFNINETPHIKKNTKKNIKLIKQKTPQELDETIEYTIKSNLDNAFDYMEKIKKDNFKETENKDNTGDLNLFDLKLNREFNSSNVRKRQFK